MEMTFYMFNDLKDCNTETTALSIVCTILGGSAHTVKENAEALLVATKEIGLEVNADKTVHGYVSGSECRAGSQCEN